MIKFEGFYYDFSRAKVRESSDGKHFVSLTKFDLMMLIKKLDYYLSLSCDVLPYSYSKDALYQLLTK